MKANTFKQLLALGTILCCQHAFGQLPSIDSMKLIPENPVETDEIKLVYYATFSSGSCYLLNHSVTIQGTQITLNLEHVQGLATYICNHVDTISLGNLNPGDYETDVNLIIYPQDAIAYHAELDFSVDQSLETDQNTNTFEVSIYPNPFQQEFRIETNNPIEKIELHAISGQKIHKELSLKSAKRIDLSDIKDGIYLLTLTDQEGNRYSKRIVKNTL